ncbi:MAG: crosslink repair DNA glycosylase YcaQ family protein [Verrucomicrobiales bacterium]
MLRLTPSQARRFHAHALGLDAPFSSVGEALAHLGYVQIDPINVCGRMHDLILRPRVEGYEEGALHVALAGDDPVGFEHYLPGAGILVAFGHEAWPYLVPHMRARRDRARGYARKLTPEEESLARRILAELRERGPLSSDEIDHDGRALTAWGTEARAVKTVLEKLFIHGRVGIASRRKFRRIYDLPERVIPAETLALPTASQEVSARWLAALRLRQRRLALVPKKELPLIEDIVEPVRIEGVASIFHCLKSDLHLVDRAQAVPPSASPRLLAPLDPLVYDRKVAARIWDFEYTWEVYTPAAKRVRGYYALPLLSGDALVGHVNPKADRKAGRLEVIGRKVARGHRAAPATKDLARFLGLH